MKTQSPSLEILEIDECVDALGEYISSSKPAIQGPHETIYGYGWTPTITYWLGRRRIHLYEDLGSEESLGPTILEIADISDTNNPQVKRCQVIAVGEVLDIVDGFLGQNTEINKIAGYAWSDDGPMQDPSIPDPPNQKNPANFAGFVGGHMVRGDSAPKEPSAEERKPWWKFW